MVLVVKKPPANAGDVKDTGSIPELGISPGGGHGNPLQYSSMENPMDRGAWWVQWVAKSRTRLKQLGFACTHWEDEIFRIGTLQVLCGLQFVLVFGGDNRPQLCVADMRPEKGETIFKQNCPVLLGRM